MTINQAIKNTRYDKGISQNRLAKLSGVRQTSISFWESGRGCPTVDDALRLSIGLGVTLAELIHDVDETNADKTMQEA